MLDEIKISSEGARDCGKRADIILVLIMLSKSNDMDPFEKLRLLFYWSSTSQF